MQIYLTKPTACSILQVEIVDIITLERRSRMREGASGSGTVANLATGSSGTFVVASSSSRMHELPQRGTAMPVTPLQAAAARAAAGRQPAGGALPGGGG